MVPRTDTRSKEIVKGSMMKAFLLQRPGPLATGPIVFSNVPRPEPGAGQVLLKVLACGVCRSNLHMVEGDWLPSTPSFTPIIPGHEVVGRIEALGTSVTGLAVGDRVGVQPLFSTCGRCAYCHSGREELCQTKEITGETVNGGYAEYMVADALFVYNVPEALSDVEAAPLFCPGITGYAAVKKAQIDAADRVGIFGIGGVGHMALQFAALTGASTVAVTSSARHRALAQELGAGQVIDSSQSDPVEELRRDGALDAALVFAPSEDVVNAALRALKPGGRLIVGVNSSIRLFPFALEKTIVGSLLGTREMMERVLSIAASGRLHVSAEAMPLAAAAEALQVLKDRSVRGRLVLVP